MADTSTVFSAHYNSIFDLFSSESVFSENEFSSIDSSCLEFINKLSVLAALFHDLGKCSIKFQKKLACKDYKKDILRHDLLSALIVKNLFCFYKENDLDWLNEFTQGNLPDLSLLLKQSHADLRRALNNDKPFSGIKDFSSVQSAIIWLVLTHHKLPQCLSENQPSDFSVLNSVQAVLKETMIGNVYGDLKSLKDLKPNKLKEYFTAADNSDFGQLGSQWNNLLKTTAADLIKNKELNHVLKLFLQEENLNLQRFLLKFGHYCLVLGDYWASGLKVPSALSSDMQNVFANFSDLDFNQPLSEHLFMTAQKSRQSAISLKKMFLNSQKMAKHQELQGGIFFNFTENHKNRYHQNFGLLRNSTNKTDKITFICSQNIISPNAVKKISESAGFKDVNTGCIYGKMSFEDLRFTDDLKKLNNNDLNADDECISAKEYLNLPLLITSMDHFIKIVECTKGGQDIFPFLRLLVSDFIIDGCDNYKPQQFSAILRLIYLIGCTGKKVVFSSPTIPPDLAYAAFFTYSKGYRVFSKLNNESYSAYSFTFADERNTENHKCSVLTDISSEFGCFQTRYINFCQQKLEKAAVQPSISARIAEYSALKLKNTPDESYFSWLFDIASDLHRENCLTDKNTATEISFGFIELQDADKCAACASFILNNKTEYIESRYPDTLFKLLLYHDRHMLYVQDETEKYLNNLSESLSSNKIFSEPSVKRIIDDYSDKYSNIIFCVISCPQMLYQVDLNFNWAVIEPVSWQHILQGAANLKKTADSKVNNLVFTNCTLEIFKDKYSGIAPLKENVSLISEYEILNSAKYSFKVHELKAIFNKKPEGFAVTYNGRLDNNPDKYLNQQQDCVLYNDLSLLEHIRLHEAIWNSQALNGIKCSLNSCWDLTSDLQKNTPYGINTDTETLNLLSQNESKRFSLFQKTLKDYKFKECLKTFNISIDDLTKIKNFKSVWLNNFKCDTILIQYNSQTEYSVYINGKNPFINLKKLLGQINIPMIPNNGWNYSNLLGLYKEQE